METWGIRQLVGHGQRIQAKLHLYSLLCTAAANRHTAETHHSSCQFFVVVESFLMLLKICFCLLWWRRWKTDNLVIVDPF